MAKRLVYMLAFLVVSVVTIPWALAQEMNTDAPDFMKSIWSIVQPLAMLGISTVGPAIVAWISYKIVSFLNIRDENEQKALELKIRDALHASALSALKYAWARVGLKDSGTISSPAVITEAVEYIKSKNPETVAKTGLSTEGLKEIVLSKVPDVLGMVVPGPIGGIAGAIAGQVINNIANAKNNPKTPAKTDAMTKASSKAAQEGK